MRVRRIALHGLLVLSAGLVLLDLLAAPGVSRALGSLLVDQGHRLRDIHVALRTGAVTAALAWAFGRFGIVALFATPLLVGLLFVGALPPLIGDEPHTS